MWKVLNTHEILSRLLKSYQTPSLAHTYPVLQLLEKAPVCSALIYKEKDVHANKEKKA